MEAQDIITKAREELINFIIFYIKLIYLCINKHEPYLDSAWEIKAGDVVSNPSVGVAVSDCEGNDVTKYSMVEKYIVKDDNLTIIYDISGKLLEYKATDLTTDELGDIANTLEETLNFYIKK